MNWCTPVSVGKAGFDLSYGDNILTCGSCFSENIGQKLELHKFNVLSNPFGTVYNPISIFEQLSCEQPNKILFANNQGVWSHFGYHSDFNELTKHQVEQNILQAHQKVKNFKPTVLILTFGTAWVYEREGRLVANCHKFPAKEFVKRLLSVEEIVGAFELLYERFEPCKMILTLSPVRHYREGLEANAVSKAVLRLAIHKICEKWPVGYFPAYEIVMDELRDYRFYAEDLLHPSNTAVDLIWERFTQAYFDAQTSCIYKKVQTLLRQLTHKPRLPQSQQHQTFLLALKTQLQELNELDWQRELKELENQLLLLRQD